MSDIINNLINIWQENEVIKSIPAEGKSMYPLIKEGDNIPVRFIKPEGTKVGDIVVFRRNNTTIVHRLIKRNGSSFIEKGDYEIRGRFINASDIFGKVEIQGNSLMALFGYIIHRLGYISKPLLIIPFIINAGTRIYIKLRSH